MAVLCGCGQILIKRSFAEIYLIGHSRDEEADKEEESLTQARQFADVEKINTSLNLFFAPTSSNPTQYLHTPISSEDKQ